MNADRRNVCRNIVDDTVQCKKDRHLYQQWKASACHACAVLLVNSLNLHVLTLHGLLIRLSFILLLDRLDLRIHDRHEFCGFLLFDRQRYHQCFHYDRKQNDAQTYVEHAEAARKSEEDVHDIAKDSRDRSQNGTSLRQNHILPPGFFTGLDHNRLLQTGDIAESACKQDKYLL